MMLQMTNVRMAKNWFGNVTKQIAIAYIAFALCALATMVAWYLSRQDASNVAGEKFHQELFTARSAMLARMQSYEQILRGGVGLFAASIDVDRAQWKRYENALVIAQLVGAKLVVLELGANGTLARETPLFANLGTRLRVPVQGPDGALDTKLAAPLEWLKVPTVVPLT